MGSVEKSPSAAPARPAAVTVVLAAALLAALAGALVAGSFASYDTVKRHLDRFASDGDASLTPDDFDALVLRLRLAGLVFVAIALGVVAARRTLGIALAGLASSAGIAAGDTVRGARRAVALESRLHLGALGLVTALALAARLAFLFQPMRYDESVTYVHYASRPWYIALTTYTAPNNHVLHSLLVHVSTLVFGGEPWAIRLPALVAGVLLVPATYLAARALYGRDAALLAAALVAGSSVLVEYSTNARGYTIVGLAFVLLLALATRLTRGGTAGEWLAFAVIGALGLWTVPVLAYGLGGVALWLALSFPAAGRRGLVARRLAPALAACLALAAVLYAPVVAAEGAGALFRNEFVRPRTWRVVVDELPDSLWSTVAGWHRDLTLPVSLALAAAFLAGVVWHRRVSRFAVPPALAVVAFALPVVALQRVAPFERVWLFALPLYLATAAAGVVLVLERLAGRAREAAALGASVLVCGALAGTALATRSVEESEDTSTFRAGREVAALLERELRPGEKVLVAPPADAILEYWLLRRGLDAPTLVYWGEPGTTRRFLVVVKEGPRDYPLEHVLADPRLAGVGLEPPRVLRRFDEATVYEDERAP